MTTRIFDAHCDTISRVADDGVDMTVRSDEGHIDLPRLREGHVGCQVFACFASRTRHGDAVVDVAERLLEHAAALADVEGFYAPQTSDQLRSLRDDGSEVGILLAVEGGDALGGDLGRLEQWKALGVRYITLAWDDTALSGSAFGGGGGLTPLGREALQRMEELGILVDVSHMSDAAFTDVERLAKVPFVATHSNCRALCRARRNLTDDQIRCIAERGGAVGVMFTAGFVDEKLRLLEAPWRARYFTMLRDGESGAEALMAEADAALASAPLPGIDEVVDHLAHLVEVGGLSCAAIGTDFDGTPKVPDGLGDCAALPALLARMRARGFSDVEVEAICWGNWERVFEVAFGV